MNRLDAAKIISGVGDFETKQASAPTNVHIITGEVGSASEDGKVTVAIDGLVFSDDEEQFVEFDTLGGLEEGDTATILLTGESGHAMVPLAIGGVGTVDRIVERVGELYTDYAEIGELVAEKASIEDLEAATARIDDLEVDTADISTLVATKASISDLNAATARIEDLEADTADISDLVATKASISDLTAATGRIDDLEADHVSVTDFQAEQANIDNLQAATADISTIRANSAKVANLTAQQLEADHATIASLDSNYVTTDFLNADVGWIANGVIKDGSISSAMISSLSANKLSAGTINGSVINVTNLNADNITAGTINGQRIGQGSLSLDKLAEDVYTEAEVDALLDTMQGEIDGAIETWTGTAVPTLNNAPASGWTTNKVKDTHVGDVYFVVNSQSQQNGYNYRFSKSTSGGQTTYSWQLIKDSDVTAALQRLTTAEGKIGTIEQFDSDISSWKTDTDEEISSIKTAHNTLAGRVTTAEGTLETKVDTTTFNEVKQTVDENSSSITQLTTTTTELRADLDGIEIGGRNLLLATAGGATTAGSTNSSVYTKSWNISDYGQSVMDNTDDIFTWSFDYEVTGNEATGAQIYAQIKGTAIVYTDVHGVLRPQDVYENPTGHYSRSVRLTSTQVSSTTQSCRIRLQSATDGAVLRVWNVKVEKGTKGSDWTAAPEDLESTVTTVSNKVSEHTQTINGFTTRIGALETTIETKADSSTVETVSNRLNTVSDTVDGHTQTISSVQDTLATKADSSTVSTLTTKVNTVSDTVDGHTSQLSRVQTRIENSDPNMLLDWNAPSRTKVDAKVGRYFSNSTYTEITSSFFAVADPPMVGIENGVRFVCDGSTHTTGRGRGLAFYDESVDTALAFVDGQSYTASWWARCTDGSGQTYCLYCNGGTNTTKNNGRRDLTSEWQLFTETFKPVKCSDYGSRVWFYGWFPANVSGTVELCGFKCVPGESAENVATTVTTLSNDYATFKQTVETFESTVGATYATKTELADQVSVRFKLIRNKWTDSQWSTYEAVGYSTSYQNKHYYTNSDTATETGFDATKVKVGDYILIEGVSTDSKSPHSVMAKITSVPTEAGNGFPATTVSGVNSTQLASRVSTAETSIQQNRDAIALRATKTEAYQVAQPNLTPYFSMPMTENADDYWYTLTSSRFTQLEDGWAHFENNNTGSSTLNHYIKPRVIDTLTPGGKYTLLAEFRNVSITGPTNGNLYSQQASEAQIWGASDATGGFTIYNSALANLEGGAGVFYKSLTTLDAESKDPSGTVRGTLPKTSFMSINQQVVAGQSISYDVRLSLYEGEYTGPYKPYAGPQLYATNAELKVTAEGISSTVERVGGFKYLESASAGASLSNIKTYAADGRVGNWWVKSINDVRVGDFVYIKYKDTTRNCDIYVKGKVLAINTSVEISLESHGYEDVLPVETIKSTINQSADSVKIQAKHIEIDGTAIFNNSDFKQAADAAYDAKGAASTAESNAKGYADAIEVGGRNLLAWSGSSGEATPSMRDLSWTHSNDGWITVTGTQSLSSNGILLLWGITPTYPYLFPASTYTLTVENDGLLVANIMRAQIYYDSTYDYLDDSGSLTFTAESGVRRVCVWFNGSSSGTAINGRIRFKLERGNRATDWTPAPEDVAADISASVVGQGGFTILWNYSNFTTANNGEAYVCELDPLTNQTSDADGWAMWNGVKRIIPHGMINPNSVVPFRIPIYVVCRLPSEDATTGTIYLVWYDDGWKYSTKSPSSVAGDYPWVDKSDIVLGMFVMTAAEGAISETVVFRTPWSSKQVTTSTVTANSAQNLANTANNTANAAAPKANAVARSQRIYYRKTSSGAPSANTTWLATSGTGYGNWSLNVPQLTSNGTKYPYLYTAVQTQTVAQQAAGTTCSCSTVLIDDSSTVIDGGNIITGTVSANAINAASGTFDTANIPNLSAAKITSGTIDSARINAASLSIGYEQLTNTPTIPSTVAELTDSGDYALQTDIPENISDLTDDVGYQTQTDNRVWYATCSSAAGSGKVATITPATTKFSLTTGQTVNVKFSNTNTLAVDSLTLNVNSTGAKNIKYTASGGGVANLPGVGYLQAGRTYQFVYDGTYWVCQMNYNTNNYDRTNYKAALAASSAIDAGGIAVMSSGKLHLLDDTTFDYSRPILYVATAYKAEDVTNVTTRTTNYTFWGTAFNLTNTHAIEDAAAGKAVYIVGTLSGTLFTPTSTVLTCNPVESTNPLVYIRLGLMSTTTNAVLESDHPMYMFFNGEFQQCDPATADAACTATSYITQVNSTGITIHPLTGTSNKLSITSDGTDIIRNNVSVANYGTSTRIGKANGPRVIIESDEVDIYGDKDGTTLVARMYESSGHGFVEAYNFNAENGIFVGPTGTIVTPELDIGPSGFNHVIQGINFGFSSASTNANGITTFNPGLGVAPTAVFVAPGKASTETEAVAKIAVPMVWSIDSATQVQVRWQRSDTNAWLASNTVGWYWLALYSS